MDTTQQSQRNRTEYIGSSDIAAIIGASRYRGAYDVYRAKVISDEQQDNEFMRWGRVLEEPVLREFCRAENITSFDTQVYAQHPEYDFIGGTVDGLTDDFVIEIKTTSSFNKSFDDKIPDDYYIQCQWLMGLHNRQYTQVAVLFGGQRLEKYEVEFNEDLYNMLIDEAVAFWTNHVITKTPPELNVKASLEVAVGDVVEATEDDIKLIEKINELKKQIEELTAQSDELKDKVFEKVGEKEGLVHNGELVAKRSLKTRTSYNTKALDKETLASIKKTTQFVERKVY